MNDLKAIRISVTVHVLLAVLVAYVTTYLVTEMSGLAVGIVLLIVVGFGLERALGKRGIKWWIANGVWLYLFTWLVAGLYFFNLTLG